MAETFLFNITERVLSKLSSIVLEEVSLAWNAKSELRKLQNSLSTIKAVLLDADEQQAKNHEVRDWLEKLKDVVYDVEDLLDELSTEVLRRKGLKNTAILRKVKDFFSCPSSIQYRFMIGQKVMDIRKRLDDIAADRRNFHFVEHVHKSRVENKGREQTHSFVRASDIIGRENDRDFIVELLISSADQETVSVIPIVGLGGLGKTTLVKLVYNNTRIVQSFDLRMWVCISEDFNLRKVIEKIIKSATGESFEHLDMDQVQRKLSEVLNATRYLLVLDDVWNEDRNRWMDLKELLMNCCMGSKIIVTTRSKMVAKITGTVSSYNLSSLSDDDCLYLFLKCAFRKQEDWLPNLVEIGKEIIKKCDGVPLAVKTLGSLLYMKTDEQEWVHIRDNDVWKIEQNQSDILPILKISYEQLPSYLRQCFAYCSMFPKGQEIPRELFINLWIAQGLIQPANGNGDVETIGNQYFNVLLSTFCFQDVVEAFDGEILACRIHNLVHDLAQSVSAAECSNVRCNTKAISEKVRHVLFHSADMREKEFPQALLYLRKLRSFSFSFKVGPIDNTFIETLTLNFICLRVLVLISLQLKELPSSISKLKQLRYLDLSYSCNLKSLPKSICKLVNLQTLNLINCEQLQGLPKKIGELSSLKTLYLTSHHMSLQKKGTPNISSLQFLLLYRCYWTNLPSEGLQHFSALRVLRIYECPRLTSLPSSIKYLTALEKLWIWDCEEFNLLEGEGMEGLKNLQSLLLMGLPKLVTLPLGLKETVAKNLKYLRIANCPNLMALPEWLLSFSSLVRLYIEDCPSLSSVPEGISNHAAIVHISGCPLL